MLGRLALTAFALWVGFNAIQMLSCHEVTWSAGRPTCWENPTGPFSSEPSFVMSGSAQGTLILIGVATVLVFLWVWPFVRPKNR
jgi:hypothetical protein